MQGWSSGSNRLQLTHYKKVGGKLRPLPRAAFLKLSTAELQGSAKGYQEFRENKLRNDRRVLLAVS
jgi:hypothetical protein